MAQGTDMLDVEYERYKDWDMSNATPARLHPMVKKLQDNYRLAQLAQHSDLLDADVLSWLVKQNSETKRHVSEMIRQALALQGTQLAVN